MIFIDLLVEFLVESIDCVELIFIKFINLVSCKFVVQILLFLDFQDIVDFDDEIFCFIIKDGFLMVEFGVGFVNIELKIFLDIVFEQIFEQLLNVLFLLYLQNQMLCFFQELVVFELVSWMMVMNNVSDNVKELVKIFIFDYNKVCQVVIIQEILEVVGGVVVVG